METFNWTDDDGNAWLEIRGTNKMRLQELRVDHMKRGASCWLNSIDGYEPLHILTIKENHS